MDHISVEAVTTVRMIPSGTNSPPAEVSIYKSAYPFYCYARFLFRLQYLTNVSLNSSMI